MTNSNCDSACKTGGQEVKTDGTKASQAAVANQQTTTNIACTQCTSGCGQNANSAEVKQDPAASAGNNVAAAPGANDQAAAPAANDPAAAAAPVAAAPADLGNSQITGNEIQSGGKKRYRSRKRQKTKKNKRKSKKSKRSKKSRKNKRKTKRKNRKLH